MAECMTKSVCRQPFLSFHYIYNKALSIIRFVHLLLFLNPSLATRGTILITLFFFLFSTAFLYLEMLYGFLRVLSHNVIFEFYEKGSENWLTS